MYCPRCGTEYIEGIAVCADCGIPLAEVLPAEDQCLRETAEFEEVLTTFNAGDLAIIKSLLDGESIEYFIQGEFFNYVEPLVQPARLMVRKDQVNETREILKDLDLEYGPNDHVEEWSDE